MLECSYVLRESGNRDTKKKLDLRLREDDGKNNS